MSCTCRIAQRPRGSTHAHAKTHPARAAAHTPASCAAPSCSPISMRRRRALVDQRDQLLIQLHRSCYASRQYPSCVSVAFNRVQRCRFLRMTTETNAVPSCRAVSSRCVRTSPRRPTHKLRPTAFAASATASAQSAPPARCQSPPHPQTHPPPARAPHSKSQNPPQSADSVNYAQPLHQPRRIARHRIRRVPVIPTREIAYTNPARGFRQSPSAARPGLVGAARNTGARSSSRAFPPDVLARLFDDHVGQQHAIRTRVLRRLRTKALHPHPHHRIQVAEQHQPHMPAAPSRSFRHPAPAHPPAACPRNRTLTGPLNHRPVRQRITEGDTQLNHIRTRYQSRPTQCPASTSRLEGSPAVRYATMPGFLSAKSPSGIRPFSAVCSGSGRRQLQLPRQDPHILVAAPRSHSPAGSGPCHRRRQPHRLGHRMRAFKSPAGFPPSGSAPPPPSSASHPQLDV